MKKGKSSRGIRIPVDGEEKLLILTVQEISKTSGASRYLVWKARHLDPGDDAAHVARRMCAAETFDPDSMKRLLARLRKIKSPISTPHLNGRIVTGPHRRE